MMYIYSFVVFVCAIIVNQVSCEQCRNIAPKFEFMNRGVDITKLVLLPLNHDEDTGFTRKIVDFSCNRNLSWTNPYNNNLLYDLPDQIEKINTIPGGVLNYVFKQHWSLEDVKSSMALDAGLDGAFKMGMFSSSATYNYYQKLITQQSNKVCEVEAACFGFQVDLKPFWKLNLSNNALIYVNNILPNNFRDEPKKFYDFFKYYGTHFVSRAKFGGKLRMSFEMKSSIYNLFTNSEVEMNAKASFIYLINGGMNLTGDSTVVRKQFTTETKMTARFYGGYTNLLNANDIQNWWESVPNNPWLFKCELEPIDNLINDKNKKLAIKEAYDAYLDKAYLLEIEKTLISIITSHKIGQQKAVELIEIATKLKQDTIPDHSAVHHLGNNVTDYFMTPYWFLYQTKLCFKLSPFDDSNECHLEKICAKPNTRTTKFKFGSGYRLNKCYVSWKLKSSNYEPWFKNVKICFASRKKLLWLPVTFSSSERCASLNEFTVEPKNMRPSSVAVIASRKWKLSVPENTPAWIRNIKICIHISLEKFGGYCGDGFNRTICAIANEWTPHQWLMTDNNACIFSWSLQTE